jgi:MFS family permease
MSAAGFLAALIVHGVLAGCFLTGTVSLLPALLPRERFSQLAAVSASLTALMVVVSTVALGALLDAMGRDYRLLYLAGAGGRLRCGAVVQPAQTLFVREVTVDFFQRFAACFRQQEGRGPEVDHRAASPEEEHRCVAVRPTTGRNTAASTVDTNWLTSSAMLMPLERMRSASVRTAPATRIRRVPPRSWR